MRIISKAILREFWGKHPDSESPLNAWHKNVEQADWSCPADVRQSYRKADTIGSGFAVSDICDNRFRLVVSIDYDQKIVYIYEVCTHPEYDRLDIPAIDREIQKNLKKKRDEREGH